MEHISLIGKSFPTLFNIVLYNIVLPIFCALADHLPLFYFYHLSFTIYNLPRALWLVEIGAGRSAWWSAVKIRLINWMILNIVT